MHLTLSLLFVVCLFMVVVVVVGSSSGYYSLSWRANLGKYRRQKGQTVAVGKVSPMYIQRYSVQGTMEFGRILVRRIRRIFHQNVQYAVCLMVSYWRGRSQPRVPFLKNASWNPNCKEEF